MAQGSCVEGPIVPPQPHPEPHWIFFAVGEVHTYIFGLKPELKQIIIKTIFTHFILEYRYMIEIVMHLYPTVTQLPNNTWQKP